MIDHGKQNLLGINISAVDYKAAVEQIVRAAHQRQSYAVSALAVHGVMTGVLDPIHARRLNSFDLLTPDGQPVRWALNLLHKTQLPDRVYGPTLTLKVCERAAQEDLGIYLYGSTQPVLNALQVNLHRQFPSLQIVGMQPSRFRQVSPSEKMEIINAIHASNAAIVLVGLGCPRQEVWVYEHLGLINAPMLAVGAAFDFHAGTLSQASPMLQRVGLEWAYRLFREPKRLWRRYLFLNPHYLYLVGVQASGLKKFLVDLDPKPEQTLLRYG